MQENWEFPWRKAYYSALPSDQTDNFYIFNNSFWSLKFYYMQFNSNPRPITFEFSVNGVTKRRVVIIKKTSYISSMLEIAWKIH